MTPPTSPSDPSPTPPWLVGAVGHLATVSPVLDSRGGSALRALRGLPGRPASVMMLFGGDPAAHSVDGAAAELILLRRAATLRKHAGQVAFPGGAADPEDADAIATALRETEEEIGVGADRIAVLGAGTPIYVPPSGFSVTPVLGFSADPGAVVAVSETETAEVRRVPLAQLRDPNNRFQVRKTLYKGPAFALPGMLVWGFTAGIIDSLLRGAGWEEPWDRGDVRELGGALQRAEADRLSGEAGP